MGSHQGGYIGCNEKPSDSGCVFKEEPTVFPHSLDVECERKEGLNMALMSQSTVLVIFNLICLHL